MVHKEMMVLKVLLELKVLTEPQVHKALKVQQVDRDHREFKVLKV